MWGYIGKRVIQMIITLLLFQAVTYFLIDAQPGDIADTYWWVYQQPRSAWSNEIELRPSTETWTI